MDFSYIPLAAPFFVNLNDDETNGHVVACRVSSEGTEYLLVSPKIITGPTWVSETVVERAYVPTA